MIKSVRLRNYKNIRQQDIDLERLTIFVGANGSGKTSVLEAIDYAMRRAIAIQHHISENQLNWDWFYTRGGSNNLSITCVLEEGQFEISAAPHANFPNAGPWRENVSPTGPALQSILTAARSVVLLQLDAPEMAKPSYSEMPIPVIESNGAGLASVLAHMALNDPDSFNRLIERARSLVPRLKRIRFRKLPIPKMETEIVRFGDESVERQFRRIYQGELILFDFDNAENISALTVSDAGTMLMLGFLTVLLGPTQPRTILMDDIERGLHPLAQRALLEVVGQIMKEFPDLQVLASTHSPYLLDQLRPEQIRLMATNANGHAICGKLTDHPEFAKWKDEMAPGELWSLFGEKWLVARGDAK